MDLDRIKSDLRRDMAARRKAVHGAVAIEPATAAMLKWIRAAAGVEVVSGYLPIRSEIDPRPAMSVLVAEGYGVCVPVVEGPGLALSFRAWKPDTALIAGAYGAAIPAEDRPLKPDLLMVPLLAFDPAGYRLGYGGGYYDRTLAALAAGGRVRSVGFAYEAQALDAVPRGPYDQPLDAIVTEARIRLV